MFAHFVHTELGHKLPDKNQSANVSTFRSGSITLIFCYPVKAR